MTISKIECPNCGDETQPSTLNEDGHCPRCAKSRISSPPPEPARLPPDVSRFRGPGHHGSTPEPLMREPLKSKIPIANWLKSRASDAEAL